MTLMRRLYRKVQAPNESTNRVHIPKPRHEAVQGTQASGLAGFTYAVRGPGTVHGFVGRSLPVMCHYDKSYQTYYKYWCKGDIWNSCTKVVKTRGLEAEVKAGRTSVKDNHTCSCFTVTLEDLREEDAGVYWCGIETFGSDPGTQVTIVPDSLPPTTTIVVTTGYLSTVHTKRLTENTPSLWLLLLIALVLLVVLLVGGLLLMWRLQKQKAPKARGHNLQSTVPIFAEGSVSNATIAANVRPNYKTPSPGSDQDLNSTLHVEYTSVKRTPAPPTQPQISSTNTEDVSYATIKFPAQDEQAIYANLK
ncbi:PREDICTED: CMRF35-like molecule 1 [Gekko japonicus]|uniref:CMRF35-like molecule 1 n=1 Tax=Gekko japonicus TaxID=146911 RepID=A0ABM1JXM1_GEKJA|nr:PREDICTED: CMRF35-like molecule 1 [Gekko japonicus]